MGPYKSIEEIKKANREAGYKYFSPELDEHLDRVGHRRQYIDRVYYSRYFIQIAFNPRIDHSEVYQIRMARNDGEILDVAPVSFDCLFAAEWALEDAIAAGPKVVRWPDAAYERAEEELGEPDTNEEVRAIERELEEADVPLPPIWGYRVFLGLLAVGEVMSESAAAALAAEIAE